MTLFLLRRLVQAVPIVLGIATLVFFLLALAPGDAVSFLVSPNITPEALEQIRRNMGLDQPVHIRYLRWMGSMLTGDFGISLTRNEPVRDIILAILPNTLTLSLSAILLAFAGGILIGVFQAVRHNRLADSALSVIGLFFYSMPSFWLALMLILVFSLGARNLWEWPIWFPASGMTSVDYPFMSPGEQIRDRLAHLVLPSLSLALVLAAGIARYMRASMLEVIRQDYVRTARSKGLSEFRVIARHALPNGLIPIVTLLGLYLPTFFSGAVLIETVFAWPGMGRLVVDAIFQRDYPVVMAGTFIFAVLVVIGNLVADALYAIVDPRIRYE
ncbi:MAG: ABC transporter permease [Gammaproteobacteria bacterium]|nr:ABC transporter permease [Gammaproteobacteria bacterium]MDE0247987.1 ABC transporter permease [Gammaproteobacteria bacterium]